MSVQRITIVGAGTMGAGIAASAAMAGFDVALVDASSQSVETGRGRIVEIVASAVKRGKLTADSGAATLERVAYGADLERGARDADLVIEAVFESLAVKREIFATLDRIVRGDCWLATNTSTLDVDAIAAVTHRRDAVVGMHFFSPAHVMRLVEIVQATSTSQAAVDAVADVTRRLGKIGVVVGNGFGFVGNRMLYGYGRENQLMLLEGVAPERIDAVLEAFGMAMGPNAVGDLAGLDVGYRVRRERADAPDDPRYYRVADALVEAGRLGQKTGSGAYRYEAGTRERHVDPAVAEIIRNEANRLGIAPVEHADRDIVDRCTLALVNEGAALLETGIARSARDIDVIWCNGYGFPRERGGPMAYANSLGLDRVRDRMQELAHRHGARYWQPAPLIDRLATANASFT